MTSQASVLVVDDDRWTTRAVCMSLATSNELRVLEPKHSGEDAVAAYASARPDVVLMDLNMPPGMSGVEATREIRSIDPTARIVILTTTAPGPGIARAIDAGAMAAVNKTASEGLLVRTVVTAAQGGDPAMLKSLANDILVTGDRIPEAPLTAPVLTPAERGVLLLVCEGHSYEEIAGIQRVSVDTAKAHARSLRQKLAAENLAQLVVRALQFKYISG